MFDRHVLPNGLRIIGERLDWSRSVSVGLWIASGSQYERPEEAGISHFLEHMVFKGTRKYTARQISVEMDALGGQMNAFTAKDCTCFYTRVVRGHLARAMDIIADLATAPKFDPEEMEKEKGVVLEEIAMAEDTPEDVVHELLMLAHYGDQPVARPILGSIERVSDCTREQLAGYWRRMYQPQRAVLAVAGSYDWDEVLRLAEGLLGGWENIPDDRAMPATAPCAPGGLVREKDIEQVHICLGYPGLTLGDDRNYELSLATTVFGGAMSSRLFQRIREDLGAAYSVYSFSDSFIDTGMLVVYAATSPENAELVAGLLSEEAEKLAGDGMTEEEFLMARDQLRSGFLLGLESTSSRMQSIGRRLLLLNATRTEEELLERLGAIRREDANALIRDLLRAPHSAALVGRGVGRLAEKIPVFPR